MDNLENDNKKVNFKEKMRLSREQKKERKALEKEHKAEVKPEDASLYRHMTIAMVVIALLLVLGTVVSLATAAVSSKKKASRLQNVQVSNTLTNVSVETVNLSHYNEIVHLNATLKSLSGVVNVYSPVFGKLKSNEVRLGDKVKKGDILGYVDGSDIGIDYEVAPVYALSDGTVTAINSVSGDTNATTSVLYTILPEGDYVLQGNISEKELGSIKIGDKATFTTVSYPNITFSATLHYISPLINETSRTALLEFDVNKDENYSKLSPGMFVSVNAETATLDNVITVPSSAVSTYLDNTVVYVITQDDNGNDKATRVNVEVERSNGNISVISKGLNVGDKIVTAGSVRDGEIVNVIGN